MKSKFKIQLIILSISVGFVLLGLIAYIYAITGADKQYLFVGIDRLNIQMFTNFGSITGKSSIVLLLLNYIVTLGMVSIITLSILKGVKKKDFKYYIYAGIMFIVGYLYLLENAFYGCKIRELLYKVSTGEWNICFSTIFLPLCYLLVTLALIGTVFVFLIDVLPGSIETNTPSNNKQDLNINENKPLVNKEKTENVDSNFEDDFAAHVMCCKSVENDSDLTESLKKHQIVNPDFVYVKDEVVDINVEDVDEVFKDYVPLKERTQNVDDLQFSSAEKNKQYKDDESLSKADDVQDDDMEKTLKSDANNIGESEKADDEDAIEEIDQTDSDEKKVNKKHRKVYHLSKHSTSGVWTLTLNGREKPVKTFKTKAEALEYADELVRTQYAVVMTHASKGAKQGRINAKR